MSRFTGIPALSRAFAKEQNGPDDFVIVLKGIDALYANLRKVFRRRHVNAPFGPSKGEIQPYNLLFQRLLFLIHNFFRDSRPIFGLPA